MVRSFETSVWLPADRVRVFEYFSHAQNLDSMTPPWFRLIIRSPAPPIEMQVGTQIEYAMRWRALPMKWRSEVTEWAPPSVFTYKQRRGPYRAFMHEHRYTESDGGTLVTDRVDFSTWFGAWIDRRWIEADLARIFEHRNRYVRRLFEGNLHHSGSPPATPPTTSPAASP